MIKTLPLPVPTTRVRTETIAAVILLRDQSWSIPSIATTLKVSERTARRYLQEAEAVKAKMRRRGRLSLGD